MLFYLFMLTAQADEPEEPKIVYKKQTEIDFEALELEGQLLKPQGALLLERKKATFNPLITLRTDFNEEMKDSIKVIE
jgi:hypothetical protein